MKCLCGYYHIDVKSKWEVERFAENNNLSEEEVIKNNGKDKFIYMNGTFDMASRGYYSIGSEPRNITLYACPKCNTVRMGND